MGQIIVNIIVIGTVLSLSNYMENSSERWVAVVYDRYGEKCDSHIFHGDEDTATSEADKWIESTFGQKQDWSFHHVSTFNH